MNEYEELDRLWNEETEWWNQYMHVKPINYEEDE